MDNYRDMRGATEDKIVSFDTEQLILVNDRDQEIGYRSKAECHAGDGILHRAFSLFVFNDAGDLLLQQRSRQKRLWPLYWANSCCSHPRRGESMERAIHRRLRQELGLTSDLTYLYKFIYQARYETVGAEHEYCWVYVGRSHGEVSANETEVEDWRFVAPADIDSELTRHPERFTPWFRLEWQRLRNDFAGELHALASSH